MIRLTVIGTRLINQRERKNMSQKDLAERVDITKASMCKYEKGSAIPRADVLARLAIALDTTADYLLGRTNDYSPLHAPALSEDAFSVGVSYDSMRHDDRIRLNERILVYMENAETQKKK